MGVINFRVYVIIAITVGALCAAVAYFDTGGATAGFFTAVAQDTEPFLGSTITNFIFTPFELVFTNIYWAIAAGVAWPFAVIWVILFLVGLGATIIGPAVSEISTVG